MYIDYKKTSWERITIPEESKLSKEQLIELIKSNLNGNSFLWDELDIEPSVEDLYGTEEFMTLEDNQGCNTIELYDDNHDLVWGNGDK